MDELCKAEEEIEDGECSDQDDIGMFNTDSMKEPKPARVIENNVYRQGRIPQIIINSDQSDQDDSDEDDYPSHEKKSRKFSKFHNSQSSSTFVNPLRTPEMTQALAEGAKRKSRNNVWGAVMTEQMLSQDIKQFGVNATLTGGYRDVETYDFTIAKEDDREDIEIKDSEDKEDIFGEVVDLEREATTYQNRKRKRNIKERLGTNKRNVKERLGTRGLDESERLRTLHVTQNDDPIKVTRAITDNLGEQNIILFTRMVEAIGNEKAIGLYNKTVDVENSGGMLINNGIRRRTPGGVYIQLLKTEPSIPEDILSAVFEEEQQKWVDRNKELRKIKKAARKKWKRKNKKLDIDLDRPETPTPPDDELEELDNANDVEVDASDLPDRPDTPEPKDSTDNESEEDDEEEDIAVAIAKAKAAIFKKQKEMSESESKIEIDGGNQDDSNDMS